MHEKLYNMKIELAQLLNSNKVLKDAVIEVNKIDMVKASLVVRNSNHIEIPVDQIMDGELMRDLPVKDYIFVENFSKLLRVTDNCLEMGNYLDKNLLISAYKILSEDDNAFYRKNNPVIYSFNHVPSYAVDIEDQLDDAMRRIYDPKTRNDIVLKAMYIHNRIIEIYPFSEFSAEIAVFAMNYFFMEKGFTPINMPIKREAYFELIGKCLKGQNEQEFYDFLLNTLSNKMEGTIKACKEYLNSKNN